MLGSAPGSADTPRAHITNMAALGIEHYQHYLVLLHPSREVS